MCAYILATCDRADAGSAAGMTSHLLVGDNEIQARIRKLCNQRPAGRRVLERHKLAQELPGVSDAAGEPATSRTVNRII